MRVSVVQLAARFGKTEVALERARALALSSKQRADLIVLPEASLTGYVSPRGDFDLTRFGEPNDGPLVQAIAGLARGLDACVAAPFVERDEKGALYNSVVVVDRAGLPIATYRKRHPWMPETWATPGANPYPLFSIGDRTVTIAVCFDVHFLAAEAADTLHAADVLLFPSAWVEEHDSREEVLPALARTHDVAIVNANWCAGDVRLAGQGGSMIIDRNGRIGAKADVRESSIWFDV